MQVTARRRDLGVPVGPAKPVIPFPQEIRLPLTIAIFLVGLTLIGIGIGIYALPGFNQAGQECAYSGHLSDEGRSWIIDGAILGLAGLLLVVFAVYWYIEFGFLAASGAAMLTYVAGSACGIRLLGAEEVRRALPWFSLLVSLGILPFIGWGLAVNAAVAVLGYLYSKFRVK